MDLLMLLLLVFYGAVVVGALLAISRLVAAGAAADVPVEEDHDRVRLRELTSRKLILMDQLRGVELDRQTGKIAGEEAARMRRVLEREAVGIMKELEALRGAACDQERAEAELRAWIAEHGPDDEEAAWSPAARLRHGGHAPAAPSP